MHSCNLSQYKPLLHIHLLLLLPDRYLVSLLNVGQAKKHRAANACHGRAFSIRHTIPNVRHACSVCVYGDATHTHSRARKGIGMMMPRPCCGAGADVSIAKRHQQLQTC